MSEQQSYVSLHKDGRLFPTWVLANFKAYHLPPIIVEGDPCNKERKGEDTLRLYQQFLGEYLSYDSYYKNILIYHGLGAGKTGNAINVYNVLYNFTTGWNVFILIKASLRESWLMQLKNG